MQKLWKKLLFGTIALAVPISFVTTTTISCGHKRAPKPPPKPTFAIFLAEAAAETAIAIVDQTHPTGWDNAQPSELSINQHTNDHQSKYVVVIIRTLSTKTEEATFTATYIKDQSYKVADWKCSSPPKKILSFAEYKAQIETDNSAQQMWKQIFNYQQETKKFLPNVNINLNFDLKVYSYAYDDTSEKNVVILVIVLQTTGATGDFYKTTLKFRANYTGVKYNITDWTLNYTFKDYQNTFSDLIKHAPGGDFAAWIDIHISMPGEPKWTDSTSVMSPPKIDNANKKVTYTLTRKYYDVTETEIISATMSSTTNLINIFGGKQNFIGEINVGTPTIDHFNVYKNQAIEWGQNKSNFDVRTVLYWMYNNQDHPEYRKTFPQNWGIPINNTKDPFTAVVATNEAPDRTTNSITLTVTPPANLPNNASNSRYNVTATEKQNTGANAWDDIQMTDFKPAKTVAPPNIPAASKTWLNSAKTFLSTYRGAGAPATGAPTNYLCFGLDDAYHNGSHWVEYPNLAKLFGNNEDQFHVTTLDAIVQTATINYNTLSIEFTVKFYSQTDTQYKTPLGGDGAVFSYSWSSGNAATFTEKDIKSAPTINHDMNAL